MPWAAIVVAPAMQFLAQRVEIRRRFASRVSLRLNVERKVLLTIVPNLGKCCAACLTLSNGGVERLLRLGLPYVFERFRTILEARTGGLLPIIVLRAGHVDGARDGGKTNDKTQAERRPASTH